MRWIAFCLFVGCLVQSQVNLVPATIGSAVEVVVNSQHENNNYYTLPTSSAAYLSIVVDSDDELAVYQRLENLPYSTSYDTACTEGFPYSMIVETPKRGDNSYVHVKCKTTCSYVLHVMEVYEKDARFNSPSSVSLTHHSQQLYRYQHTRSSQALKFTLDGLSPACHADLFVAESELPNRDNSFPLSRSDGKLEVVNTSVDRQSLFYIGILATTNGCSGTLRIEDTTIERMSTELISGKLISTQNKGDMDYYFAKIIPGNKFLLKISAYSPITAFIKYGSIPSDTDYDIKRTVNSVSEIDVPIIDDKQSETVFLGIYDPEQSARYSLMPVMYNSAIQILHSDEEAQGNLDVSETQNWVIGLPPQKSLDIITRISDVNGDVDVYIKLCQGDIDQTCKFHSDDVGSAMENSYITRAKRVEKDRHVLVKQDSSYCRQGPCWVSVYVVGRSFSTFRLRTVVNAQVGSRSQAGGITLGEDVLIRYEVANILTTSISFGLDCNAMECPSLDGSLKVSRLYPDAHRGMSSSNTNGKIKYQTTLSGKPSEMIGLYYIHVSYTAGKKKQLNFKVDIQEVEMQDEDTHYEVYNQVLNYDYLLRSEPIENHTIKVFGTEEEPAPIQFTLIPLNAYFTLCLAPPDRVASTTNDPYTYPWCVTETNANEEYELKLNPSDQFFEVRGTYKVFIKATNFLEESGVASYILQYNAGDNRTVLIENHKAKDTLSTLTDLDQFEIISHYHEDVYIYIEDNAPEDKNLEWDVFIQDENANIVYIEQWRKRDWINKSVSLQSFYVPWEKIKLHSKENSDINKIYVDVRLAKPVPTQYSVWFQQEQNIPEMISSTRKMDIELLKSQLDFFYTYAEEQSFIYVYSQRGIIQIYTRIISATDTTEGSGPANWNRPIIDQYTQTKSTEQPDMAPTKVTVTEDMIDELCAGQCKVIIGILCMETDTDSCAYDIYSTFEADDTGEIPIPQPGNGNTTPSNGPSNNSKSTGGVTPSSPTSSTEQPAGEGQTPVTADDDFNENRLTFGIAAVVIFVVLLLLCCGIYAACKKRKRRVDSVQIEYGDDDEEESVIELATPKKG